MLLSNIAAAVVFLICIAGLLRLIYVNKTEMQKEIETLRAKADAECKTMMALTEAVNELYDKLRDKEDKIAEAEDSIRKWNEGVSNILNYSLDVARGDKR